MLAIVLAISVFTACSNTQKETADTSTGEEKETTDTNAGEELEGQLLALGSSAMQPLVEEASTMFMENNPNVQIQVQGGGSGTGLSQVSEGSSDIGNSDVFAEEKDGIDASVLVDHKICVVGMGAVANSEVGVDNLSKQQLIDIFTGEITNWKDVGGNDQEIILVNRPKSSGTRATFYTFALDKNEEAEGIQEESSGTVKQIVSETPGAIGYLAFSYYDDSVKALSLDGVEANEENVMNGTYPVWAYEHSYTKGEPNEIADAFLKYMKSDEFQNDVVPSMGYIAETKMQVERDAEGNVTEK
jgi:phosphate transport system substrate-binding protein